MIPRNTIAVGVLALLLAPASVLGQTSEVTLGGSPARIEVTGGANLCADDWTLNGGAITGAGTWCGSPLLPKADYNGDRPEEIGVFRNGMWYMTYSPAHPGTVDLSRAFGSPVAGRDAPEIAEFGCVGSGTDSQRDLAVLRGIYSTWTATLSPAWDSAPDFTIVFGTTSHKRLPLRRLDTNGDGCTDIGVFRNGCFYVTESPDYVGFETWCFGPGTDEPLAGDLDGDGKSDLILWRTASSHYTYRLASETYSVNHTADLGSGDLPLVADLNGDGRADLGSFRQAFATFRFTYSPDFTGVDLTVTHGVNGDIPLVADVNGDGTDDLGIFRDAVARWWFRCSPGWGSTCLDRSFGVSGDIPIFGTPPGMP